jgi:hypothetical protein
MEQPMQILQQRMRSMLKEMTTHQRSSGCCRRHMLHQAALLLLPLLHPTTRVPAAVALLPRGQLDLQRSQTLTRLLCR